MRIATTGRWSSKEEMFATGTRPCSAQAEIDRPTDLGLRTVMGGRWRLQVEMLATGTRSTTARVEIDQGTDMTGHDRLRTTIARGTDQDDHAMIGGPTFGMARCSQIDLVRVTRDRSCDRQTSRILMLIAMVSSDRRSQNTRRTAGASRPANRKEPSLLCMHQAA